MSAESNAVTLKRASHVRSRFRYLSAEQCAAYFPHLADFNSAVPITVLYHLLLLFLFFTVVTSLRQFLIHKKN
jgi:hypothetical protein